jgi:hypothetical protein
MFSEAVFLLFLAKMMLLFLPLSVCIAALGKETRRMDVCSGTVLAVRTAIRRANRLAFWKNKCIVQSIAARWMLRRRRIPTIFTFGVMHDPENKIRAHAWLTAGNIEIVEQAGDYLPLMNL